MKFYSVTVIVLLLGSNMGYCSVCEEDSLTNMIETTTTTEEPVKSTPTTTTTTEKTPPTTQTSVQTTIEPTTTTTATTPPTTPTTITITTATPTNNPNLSTTIKSCVTTTKVCTTTTSSCKSTTTVTCTTEPTPVNLASRVRTLKSLFDCSTLRSGTILIDAHHCRRYYVCSSGRTKRYRCPASKWYDRQTLSCRLKYEVKNCPAKRN